MATGPLSEALQQLHDAMRVQDVERLTDGQLLECFISRRDAAAMEVLVRRHGPMVWGVCRRILRTHHDAEDAFQATFLVLVRKAGAIASRELLANWLYGVARRTALKARAGAKRQRERQVADLPEPEAAEQAPWHDLWPMLDRELSRLPEKYRAAFVLCDLEGQSRQEAARRLGLPEGTVASRLARARAMLAQRLARRGLVVSGVLTGLSQEAVPAAVMSSTIQAAVSFAAGRGTAGLVSIKAAALAAGVLRAMLLTKLKTVTAVLLLVAGVFAIGGGLLTPTPQAGAGKPAARVEGKKEADQKPRADKVRALLQERLATLKQIAAETEEVYKRTGRLPPQDVLQAKLNVAKAELDLCESDKERVAVHERMVALTKEVEVIVGVQVEAARLPHVDLLRARVSRLEAEVALERARVAATRPK